MGPLEDCARRAAELGYDALSLTVNRPGELDAAYVRRVLGEYGLTASGLAAGRIYTVDGLGLGLADQERRQAAVDRMLSHAELCAQLGGAKLIVGAIRGWTRDAGGREAYEPLFRSSMESILARAEQLGIQVAFEAISRIDRLLLPVRDRGVHPLLPLPCPPAPGGLHPSPHQRGRRISTKGC